MVLGISSNLTAYVTDLIGLIGVQLVHSGTLPERIKTPLDAILKLKH